MKTYFSGLRFGMLLQLAIGPMCLMVFHVSQNSGFRTGMSLVSAIALVDALYIALASLGVSKLMERKGVKKTFRTLGAGVLILFGANIILNVFGVNIIPGLDLAPSSSSVFFQGLLMTLSNPLTIIFWGSVLTARLLEDRMEKTELMVFSLGLVSATVFFMTAVAILGTILSDFIPDTVSRILNLAVGAAIIFFGAKLLVRRTEE